MLPRSVTLSLSLAVGVGIWHGMRGTEEVEEQWENLTGSSRGWSGGTLLYRASVSASETCVDESEQELFSVSTETSESRVRSLRSCGRALG